MNKDYLISFIENDIEREFNLKLEEYAPIVSENIENCPENDPLSLASTISATYANMSVQVIKTVLCHIVENFEEFK